MMARTNFTERGTQAKTFEELRCYPSSAGGSQQQSIIFSAVNILFSIIALLGNSLILAALHKESALHPPSKLLYRCLATTDLLIGLAGQPLYATYYISLVYEDWDLCRYAVDAAFITGYALCGASLLTITAISVDRLLALQLGLRYKQVVTLKRTYIILATFWIVSCISAFCYVLDPQISFWCSYIVPPPCLMISVASYIKIFSTLRCLQAKVQDPIQQQPSAPNALNMARYRKAVYSALWVQLTLVVCYLPYIVMQIKIVYSKTYPSQSSISFEIAYSLVYFNSTLNPFLYCWNIYEVRQAVKQTMRQAFSCAWS